MTQAVAALALARAPAAAPPRPAPATPASCALPPLWSRDSASVTSEKSVFVSVEMKHAITTAYTATAYQSGGQTVKQASLHSALDVAT